jgi:acyl-coenzyme A thioesterase PaaI-like protein
MSSLHELLARIKETGDFTALTGAIPYARFLGISVERSGNELLTKLSFSDALIGNPSLPALHGGATGALLESAAIFQVIWESETLTVPKTISITIAYLRSGRPADTYARGIVTRHGRRVVHARALAWQEDPARPIAEASAHFLITPANG